MAWKNVKKRVLPDVCSYISKSVQSSCPKLHCLFAKKEFTINFLWSSLGLGWALQKTRLKIICLPIKCKSFNDFFVVSSLSLNWPKLLTLRRICDTSQHVPSIPIKLRRSVLYYSARDNCCRALVAGMIDVQWEIQRKINRMSSFFNLHIKHCQVGHWNE